MKPGEKQQTDHLRFTFFSQTHPLSSRGPGRAARRVGQSLLQVSLKGGDCRGRSRYEFSYWWLILGAFTRGIQAASELVESGRLSQPHPRRYRLLSELYWEAESSVFGNVTRLRCGSRRFPRASVLVCLCDKPSPSRSQKSEFHHAFSTESSTARGALFEELAWSSLSFSLSCEAG